MQIKKEMQKHKKSTQYAQYIAVILFVAAMSIMTWEALPRTNFPDRERYIHYFLHEINILDYREFNNLLDYVKHEALWHYMVSTLVDDFGLSIQVIFFVISAFCLTVFSVFLVNRAGPVSIVLLFNPLLVAFAFSQLRMALAYSLMLVAYMVRKPLLIIVLILPALFIHTSMLIIVGVYGSLRIIEYFNKKKWFGHQMVFTACIVTGVSISIAIGPLRDVILGAVGDRRANYGDGSSSILYTLYWVGMLGLTAIQRKSFYKDENNRYSIIILSLVTINLITGGYTLRFLSIGLPMMVATMLDMDKTTKIIALFFYTAYLLFQWIYWLKIGLLT